MLYGLLRPDRGTIRIDGGLGVLPDSRGLYDRLTARENVRYFGRLQGLDGDDLEQRIDRLIELLDLKALADRRTHGFSHGERVKVAIARAIVHDPQNVVLDEPTSALDVASTRAMRRFLTDLASSGRCVLFSSHIMQEVAALTDRIVIVARGRVVASGSHEELLAATNQSTLEDAFLAAIGTAEGLYP
jgi:sodium transport system ATP-binding protein